MHGVKEDFVLVGARLPPTEKVKWVLSDSFTPVKEEEEPTATQVTPPKKKLKVGIAASSQRPVDVEAPEATPLSATLRRRLTEKKAALKVKEEQPKED